ncbi:hypothetical protein ABPG72_011301 [Tetrahymena utriculariae]
MDFSSLYKKKEVKCLTISTFQSKSHDILTNEFDYRGIHKDISGISNLLMTLQLIVCNPISLDKYNGQKKDQVTQALQDFFNIQGSEGSIIYFNGHGNNKGDWILSNQQNTDNLDQLYDQHQTLEFNELYNDFWKQRKNAEQNNHLFLIIDCCSANKWVERAKPFKDISIITAQQEIHQGKFISKLQKKVGSYFTIYFCNTFNPVQENQKNLDDCIQKKFLQKVCQKNDKKCQKQLFCKHNEMKLYCHMPSPEILRTKFNFQIDSELTDWSQLDTIRKNLIDQYHQNSSEYLQQIFDDYKGKNRVSVLEDLGYDQDECINPYSVHFVNIILYLDNKSFEDLIKFSKDQTQKSRKITFQFEDLYHKDNEDNFKKMIQLISKRDHVSIDMHYCQITDDQFKIIIDSIVQNSAGNLKTLDLNVSFNQITTKSINLLLQSIKEKAFQNLENLFLNFAWNKINENDILQEEINIPLLNKLKSLCISFNQNSFKKGSLIITKYLSDVKTLQLLYMYLENCNIEDSFINDIKEFIYRNRELRFFYLNLKQNKITGQGGKTLRTIHRETNIKGRFHISLYGNKFLGQESSIRAENPKEQDSFLELFRSIKYYNK